MNSSKLNGLKPLPESKGQTSSVYTSISDGKVITVYNKLADTIATLTFTEADKAYNMVLKEGRKKPVEGTVKTNGDSTVICTDNNVIIVFILRNNVYFICSDSIELFEEE
jgi:hypothetical protein